MKKDTLTLAFCAGSMVLAAAALVSHAGPLNPPAGAVSSTYKTLNEVEPSTPINATNTPGDANSTFKITQPGAYHLTGNVQGSSGRIGIEVVVSHVTIDLRGFELVGVGGSLAGIDINVGAVTDVTVRNGSIRGWGNSGILGNMSSPNHFHDLHITSITGYGILVNSGSIIERCRISGCSLDGIGTSNNVVVIDCVSGGNGGHGFALGTSSQVINCQAGTNSGTGINVGNGGVVENCIATLNGGAGISSGLGGTVQNSRADVNGAAGILVGAGSVVRGCSAYDNGGNGIEGGLTSTVSECSSSQNTGSGISVSAGTIVNCTARENDVDGLVVTSGGSVINCVAASNDDDGIAVGSGSTVTGCTCSTNGDDGISGSADCRIRGNQCDNNGSATADGAGIHLGIGIIGSVSDTRIEDNNCTDGDYGVWVEQSGNVVIRNTCSGNAVANFSVAAGSSVGTIFNIVGGTDITTSNSWANFEY